MTLWKECSIYGQTYLTVTFSEVQLRKEGKTPNILVLMLTYNKQQRN